MRSSPIEDREINLRQADVLSRRFRGGLRRIVALSGRTGRFERKSVWSNARGNIPDVPLRIGDPANPITPKLIRCRQKNPCACGERFLDYQVNLFAVEVEDHR